MRLYHSTTEDAARSILVDGFRDGRGSYGLEGMTLEGVFLAVEPIDENQGARDSVVLLVDLDLGADELAQYAIEEEGQPVWEYLLPAAVVNERGTVRYATLADL